MLFSSNVRHVNAGGVYFKRAKFHMFVMFLSVHGVSVCASSQRGAGVHNNIRHTSLQYPIRVNLAIGRFGWWFFMFNNCSGISLCSSMPNVQMASTTCTWLFYVSRKIIVNFVSVF